MQLYFVCAVICTECNIGHDNTDTFTLLSVSVPQVCVGMKTYLCLLLVAVSSLYVCVYSAECRIWNVTRHSAIYDLNTLSVEQ